MLVEALFHSAHLTLREYFAEEPAIFEYDVPDMQQDHLLEHCVSGLMALELLDELMEAVYNDVVEECLSHRSHVKVLCLIPCFVFVLS